MAPSLPDSHLLHDFPGGAVLGCHSYLDKGMGKIHGLMGLEAQSSDKVWEGGGGTKRNHSLSMCSRGPWDAASIRMQDSVLVWTQRTRQEGSGYSRIDCGKWHVNGDEGSAGLS